MSVDPLTSSYPWYTPYQFAGNKPIWAVDLDGLEELLANTPESKKLLADYISVASLNDVLNRLICAPFTSCVDPDLKFHIVKGRFGAADGITFDGNRIKVAAERAFFYQQHGRKGLEKILDYTPEQATAVELEFSILQAAGLNPREVLEMSDAELYNHVIIVADDLPVLAHEVYLHGTDLLDKIPETTSAEEHIYGFGKEAYSNGLNPQLSPENKDVNPKSPFGKVLNLLTSAMKKFEDDK